MIARHTTCFNRLCEETEYLQIQNRSFEALFGALNGAHNLEGIRMVMLSGGCSLAGRADCVFICHCINSACDNGEGAVTVLSLFLQHAEPSSSIRTQPRF